VQAAQSDTTILRAYGESKQLWLEGVNSGAFRMRSRKKPGASGRGMTLADKLKSLRSTRKVIKKKAHNVKVSVPNAALHRGGIQAGSPKS